MTTRSLVLDLGRLVGRVVEDQSVAVAEDVVADPAHDLQVAEREHGGEHRLHQGLAGLAVLAGVEGAGGLGQLVEGRQRGTQAGREVDVGVAATAARPAA